MPRSVEPLTRRLRSVHARLNLCVHRLIPSELVAVTLSMSCSADYDHRNTISLFVLYSKNAAPSVNPSPPFPPGPAGEGRMSAMRNVLHWEE